MATVSYQEVKVESIPMYKRFIEESEQVLKYTKQTVRRNQIKREILFWQGQLDEAEGRENRYHRRYPVWRKRDR